jgi:hypothetical protein
MIDFKALSQSFSFSDDERAVVVAQLRQLADHIEQNKWPMLIAYKSSRNDASGFDFETSLSMPWGG